ncbi:nephrin isoform X2 [Anthonomus grandis grandis]|uniref:nephrin isoform X2 n=1 Tax=Anthonomus grandis grandis TaxID=2921223 RepID=UPI002165C084|nr:nephrin isoform X2 [Anthonomus grandis grandis]
MESVNIRQLWFYLLIILMSGVVWFGRAAKPRIDDEPATSVHDVEAVLGKIAKLPCDIEPSVANDRLHIVIWFKEVKNKSDPNAKEKRVPIYSLDARDKPIGHAEEWKDEKMLGQRATFRLKDRPAILMLNSVREDDGAIYYCRVDFRQTPTRNIKVNLTIIVPTQKLKIIEGPNENHIKDYKLGPFNEGTSVNITCEATGGRPLPKVTWWLENALLDESMEYITTGSDDDEDYHPVTKVRNVLNVEKIDRKTLNQKFTCQATNSRLVHPISSTIDLDVNLKPLYVKLRGQNKPLSAEHIYELECEVIGSRPEPTITWWKGSTQMKDTRETTSPDGNITTSVLTFKPTVEDGGKYLSCRGQQPLIPDSGIEDGWKLDIHHVPLVSLELGSTLNGSTIKEGVDVYFECNIKSNPWVYKVSWRHNGKQLYNNLAAGTIVSNQSLVLQSITSSRSGHYTCVGHNQEGDGESNSVYLDVKYSPVCRPGQPKVFGVARHEAAKITCEIEANPLDAEFMWKFNNSADAFEIPHTQVYTEKGRSTAIFKPITEQDYGTLLCWARNEIGMQKEPCVFYITPAGKPDSLSNCTISNQTSDSIYIECSEGFDGGLPQVFVMEVYESANRKLVSNVTSRVPLFIVTGLESGAAFDIALYAMNKKGRSTITHLPAFTLKAEKHTAPSRPVPPENCTVHQHYPHFLRIKCQVTKMMSLTSGNTYLLQIYDANTRMLLGTATSEDPEDINYSGLSSEHKDLLLFVRSIDLHSVASDATIIYASNNKMRTNRASTPVLLQITPLLGVLIGVVAALILLAIIIVVVIRLRGGGDRDDKEFDDGGLSSAGRRCVAGNNSDKASTEPLNKDMNDSVDSLEEKNPDIIPQNNGDDDFQDEERAFERLNNAPSVRVYSRLQSPNCTAKNGGYGKSMAPHVIYNQHPPGISMNVIRRQEPTVYAQLDMKRIPPNAMPMPHPGGFQTLHHPHLPAYMTRPIRDDQMLTDGSISSETPLLGTGSTLSSLKDMSGMRTPSVTSTLPRPVTATRF